MSNGILAVRRNYNVWLRVVVPGVIAVIAILCMLQKRNAADSIENFISDARASVRKLEARRSSLDEQKRSLAQFLHSGSARPDSTGKSTSASDVNPASVHLPAAKAAQFGADYMANHPEALDAFRSYRKASTLLRYTPLIAQLQLSGDAADKFTALVSQLDGAEGLVVSAGGQVLPISATSPINVADINDQIALLIGTKGMEALKEYDRMYSALALTGDLAAAVSDIQPLMPDQAQRVALAIAANSPSYVNGGNVYRKGLHWPAIEAALATDLMPEQIMALQAIRAQEEFQAAAQELARRGLQPATHR